MQSNRLPMSIYNLITGSDVMGAIFYSLKKQVCWCAG